MVSLTDANKTTVNEGLSVIDFYAEWCGPCKTMHPIYNSISEKYKDKVNFYKCDVDTTYVSQDYNVKNIPCFIFMKNGEIVNRVAGLQSEEQMETMVNNLISK